MGWLVYCLQAQGVFKLPFSTRLGMTAPIRGVTTFDTPVTTTDWW